MPNIRVQAAAEGLPIITRRKALGLMAAASVPPTAAVAVAAAESKAQTIDAFFAMATPAEKARYHANALADALAELHPDYSWRGKIDHARHFAFVVGDPIPGQRPPVVKAFVDDGSPLRADDVTCTTAFADWEAKNASL